MGDSCLLPPSVKTSPQRDEKGELDWSKSAQAEKPHGRWDLRRSAGTPVGVLREPSPLDLGSAGRLALDGNLADAEAKARQEQDHWQRCIDANVTGNLPIPTRGRDPLWDGLGMRGGQRRSPNGRRVSLDGLPELTPFQRHCEELLQSKPGEE